MIRSYRKKCRGKGTVAKNAPRRLLIVRPRPADPRQGLVGFAGRVLPCALGRSGISARKREGDGATPLGRLRVLAGYFRQDRPPTARRCGLVLKPISVALGWCEVPDDRNYNRPIRLPYGACHERMRRDDDLYDVCLVLDWNIRPRRRGRGSAIFLHLARPGLTPTEGCVAVSRGVMRQLLPHLNGRSLVCIQR